MAATLTFRRADMKRSPLLLTIILLLLATPLVAAKRAFTIEDLYRVVNPSSIEVSPDGRSLVYQVATTDLPRAKRSTQVWLMNLTDGTTRQLTRGEASATDPHFSPDGKWISFLRTENDQTNLWLLPVEGGEAHQLTKISTGVSDPLWAPDGTFLVFASDVYPECGADDACNSKIAKRWANGPLKAHMADELLYRHWTAWKDGTRTHIFRVDLDGGKIRDLTPGDYDSPPFQLGGPRGYDISPDSKELVFMTKRVPDPASSTNADLWSVPLDDPDATAKQLTTNEAWDGTPRYSPDGTWIAYRMQKIPRYEADLFRVAIIDRRTGESRVMTESFDNWIDDFAWSSDSKSILFLGQVQGNEPIYRLTIADGTIRDVLTHATIGEFDSTPDGSIVYTSRSVGQPAEIYVSKGGRRSALTHLNDALAAEVDIRPAERMWVDGALGAKIEVFIVKPHGFDPSKKYPLILNVHGGPQMMWGDGFRGDWQVYPGAGYVVAFPNPHGSTGYGQEFTAQISGDWGGAVYEDLMKVTDALEKLPYVDADRIGAMGWSYGGYMMNWFLGHTDRFEAIASMMGVYDLRSMYGATEELWFPEWDLKGQPWNSEHYEKWSPSSFVENFKTPTLVISGERDYRVPYTQSLELFTDLQKMGVPSRLIIFSNAGHWPSWHEMVLYYTAHLEWFQKYLGGGEAPWTTEAFLRNAVFDKESGTRIEGTK
jgi:dipeptidyl aminopeptidase/acylaminoacyl peptidase